MFWLGSRRIFEMICSIFFVNFNGSFLLVFHSTSKQDPTENFLRSVLVGDLLRLELSFNFPREHVTELIDRANQCLRLQLRNCWMNYMSILKLFFRKIQLYRYTQVLVPKFVPFRFYSKSFQRDWDFCLIEFAAQQYAGWTLDSDCKNSAQIVICKLSRRWMLLFTEGALQAEDVRTTTISFQCSLFLHDIRAFQLCMLRHGNNTGNHVA